MLDLWYYFLAYSYANNAFGSSPFSNLNVIQSVIDKYEVRNQVLTILPKINEKYDNLKSSSGTGVGFGQYFVGMVKNNRNSNRYMSYGTQFCNGYNFVDN